jgi:hypothetical protein
MPTRQTPPHEQVTATTSVTVETTAIVTYTVTEESIGVGQEEVITDVVVLTDTTSSDLPGNQLPTADTETDVTVTPNQMPVTGASSANRVVSILLTVAAIAVLLFGLSLAENRGEWGSQEASPR